MQFSFAATREVIVASRLVGVSLLLHHVVDIWVEIIIAVLKLVL